MELQVLQHTNNYNGCGSCHEMSALGKIHDSDERTDDNQNKMINHQNVNDTHLSKSL